MFRRGRRNYHWFKDGHWYLDEGINSDDYTYIGPCRCGFGPHAFYKDKNNRILHASEIRYSQFNSQSDMESDYLKKEIEILKKEKKLLENRIKELEDKIK